MTENIFGTPPKIVRNIGDLKRVEVDGKTFTPSTWIVIENMGTFRPILYGSHFIFRDARRKGWTLFCTCGSPAAVIGYDAYSYGASKNQGSMIACLHHTGQVTGEQGFHADGSK